MKTYALFICDASTANDGMFQWWRLGYGAQRKWLLPMTRFTGIHSSRMSVDLVAEGFVARMELMFKCALNHSRT